MARKASVRSRPDTGSRTGGKSAVTPAKARTRKPRGSGFYTGFGLFGLCFSVIFGISTYTTYNSDTTKYPAKVAAYNAAEATYSKQLTAYNTAVAKHAKTIPAKPKAPQKPTKPELNAGSFALPVLYALLSIAYLYLGYRARMQSAAAARGPPAKSTGSKD